jgi:hypothetical protein
MQNVRQSASYKMSSLRNRYPCRVTGERFDENTRETIVFYKVIPRKEEFEIKLKDLLEDQHLIEKFHPAQTVKLGFMAFAEIFFNFRNKEDAYLKYREIVKKMSQGE